MALLFVRHGSTKLNAGDPEDPRDQFRGWTQVPLSALGRQAGAQTAAWLKHVPVQQIISSDLPRAAETAQMIGQTTGAPVKLDPRLRPLNIGSLTGQTITPENIKVLDAAHKNWDMPILGGESYREFINRYTSVLPELLKAGQQGNVVVVTHHRNLLALPHLMFGQELKTKGPPDPGGVMALTAKGMKPLFSPPAEAASSYKKEATS